MPDNSSTCLCLLHEDKDKDTLFATTLESAIEAMLVRIFHSMNTKVTRASMNEPMALVFDTFKRFLIPNAAFRKRRLAKSRRRRA